MVCLKKGGKPGAEAARSQEDAATAPGVFRMCLGVNTGGLRKISELP